MKKILGILVLGLLLSGNVYAKVKTVEKNENYIILKYSSLLKLKEKKQRKLLYKTMMVATDHCNSVGKSAYLFLGFAHGESEITRGTYTIDMDLGRNFKTYQHRIICSKDLQSGLKLFKNRVANYDSELNLNIRPREYLINGLENRKKISSLAEEKKKKIMAKQKSVAKKIDNPVEERNKLLNSCLKDNRETLIKLKNTECEAYADGKAVDIGDDSANVNEFSVMSKKNVKIKNYNYDNQRYNKCYAEMTYAHSKRGLLKSNIEFSVKVRNTVCKAYAKGEDLDYEGKR
ncbi:hypothetical protein N9E72_01365 [Candidatus Pelagibacter sp.]|jgi:hypothetical protein|nr:hypothetical protein [Candidatus Pelagibacter sp.]